MKHSLTRALPLPLTLTLAMLGCGASPSAGPHAPSTLTVTSADGQRASADAVIVVPRPARSLARLRGLVRGSAAATAALAATSRFETLFDLDQPIQSVKRGDVQITSFGVSRAMATKLREKGGDGACDVTADRALPRMFCGLGDAALTPEARKLGSLAPRAAASDLHMAISREGLSRQLGSKDLAPRARTLMQDFSGVSLDVSLEGTPEVRLAFALEGEDPLTSVLLDAPVAPPPAAFFRLPADAEVALFAHAPAAADIAGLRASLLDEGARFLDEGCTPAETAETRSHLDALLFTGGTVAMAAGFDRRSLEGAAAAAKDEAALGALEAADRAWFVLGFEEPSARWVENVSWLARHACGPSGTRAKVGKPSARLGLPAGAVEIVEPKSTSGKFTLVVPDGASRTWLAIGDDEAALASHVRVALRGATDATLAGRPGLAQLRGAATFGGFVTAMGAGWVAGHGEPQALRAATLAARALPTGGRTPIPFRGSVVRAEAGTSGSVSVRVALDGSALGDLLSVFQPGQPE
jgi:hypothetical protein